MKRILLILWLAASLASGGCKAQMRTVFEPVRFEDGTPVEGDPEADALFEQDKFLTDTTFTAKGDTLFIVRHASAYVRMQLEGLPAGAGIDRIMLAPVDGEVSYLPAEIHEAGSMTLWMAKEPGTLPEAAAIAQGADGRFWSVRLPGMDLEPGIAYRWTGTFLPPDAPAAGIKATALPQTPLDIPSGEYSGITWIAANYYAVVSDSMTGGGLLTLHLPMDRDGRIGGAAISPMNGTERSKSNKPDNEGVAFTDGKLYVSTEKQTIREYDADGRPTGMQFDIPGDMGPGAIVANMGFEALSYGNGLFWTTTEGPLKKDTFFPRLLRLQSFGRDGKPAGRYFYQMDDPTRTKAGALAYVHGVPALAALDDGRLLVLEREVHVPDGGFFDKLRSSFTRMQLFLVDPVHDTAGILRKTPLCSFRTGAMDLANYEGMCLGPTLPDGSRTLVLIADSQNGSGGLTGEFVKVILLR